MDQTRKQAKLEFADVAGHADRHRRARAGRRSSKVLDLAAVALAAEKVGGAQKVLEMAVEYAKVRVQFGRPIGSFQAIKHKCADMLLEVESAKSAAYYAGWVRGRDQRRAARRWPSLAKAYCSEAYFHAAAENIQIHGGIGFTWEHPAHLYFKRAKCSELSSATRRTTASCSPRSSASNHALDHRGHTGAPAFREEVRGWLREKLPSGWAEAIETGNDEKLDKAREGWDFMGWSRIIGMSGYGAPLWPKEYGGLSGEPWQQQVVREELARYRLPTVGMNILGVGLAGPTLIAHGNEDAEDSVTSRRSSRPKRSGASCSASRARVPTCASAGDARRARNGDEWIVNGQKVWTSIAQISQFGMLLARTDPDVPKHEGCPTSSST